MYYKNKCLPLASIPDLIDEVYYSVTDVEPWLSGNARGPSTAFCLLHRLGGLRPTRADVATLLSHADSPYIRAVGFLFLRYVADPRTVWSLIEPYLTDGEAFSPSPPAAAGAGGGKGSGAASDLPTVTMGAFVRDLFLSHVYFETLLPRIPKPVADGWVATLAARGLPTAAAGNGGLGGRDRRGGGGIGERPQSVKAALAVSMGQRAPNRAGAVEAGRGVTAVAGGGGGRRWSRSPPRRPPPREDDRRWGGDDRRRSPPRYRERSRSRSPPRHRDRSPDRRREGGGGGGGGDHRRGGGGWEGRRDEWRPRPRSPADHHRR